MKSWEIIFFIIIVIDGTTNIILSITTPIIPIIYRSILEMLLPQNVTENAGKSNFSLILDIAETKQVTIPIHIQVSLLCNDNWPYYPTHFNLSSTTSVSISIKHKKHKHKHKTPPSINTGIKQRRSWVRAAPTTKTFFFSSSLNFDRGECYILN